ncbi:MAG TPA: ferredoxin [Allosphingosinicella sp.]|nr:ferredoxin [Allosphingosinicella sp.]
MAKPHPSNAPGPFYVEDGCCIRCGVPHDIAPELFDWAEDESHCFVRRQPVDSEETDSMVRALWSAEVSCIRYCGTDPALLRRLAELGSAGECDVDPGRTRLRFRDRAVFRSRLGEADSAVDLADRFEASLRVEERPYPYKFRPRRRWRPAKVIFSWDAGLLGRRGHFHSVTFAKAGGESGLFEARFGLWTSAIHGLALIVDDWLKGPEAAQDVRWFSADELRAGGSGFHMPI